jgi:uncharacterized protein
MEANFIPMGAASIDERSKVPNLRAFHVMTKPIGPICNLDCKYCFYLEKESLFPANERFAMSDHVLEEYIRQHIEGQSAAEISFAWQGGEPTLLGVKFFRKVVAFQAKYALGKTIRNALQTNGTLLNDEWGEFLHMHRFLVGLSIDGPRDLHDTYRVDKKQNPTFEKVMAGLEILKKHRVDFNTLTVVNRPGNNISAVRNSTACRIIAANARSASHAMVNARKIDSSTRRTASRG